MLGAPRFLSLDAHWGSDETRWLNRSKDFISAVHQGRFADTLVTYHPGVMTMWVAGLRTFFMAPDLNVENLAAARFLIGIVVWAGIGTACLLLYKLFGQWVALAGFACLAYSPLFLAQTRRVHTDALATIFILLTVLLFLCYCRDRQHPRYLIFAGIAFGLAFLSKTYALILLPWLPLTRFLYPAALTKKTEKRGVSIALAEMFCFLNCALLTILALWPVFWSPGFIIIAAGLLGLTFMLLKGTRNVKDASGLLLVLAGVAAVFACLQVGSTLSLVVRSVNWAVTTPHEVEHLFLGKVVSDPGWLFYPLALSIKSTPLMLPLAALGCLRLWRQRKQTEAGNPLFRTACTLVIGVALFTFCLSAASKKFPRYLLPAFVLLEILAAIGIVEGLKWGYTALQARFGTQVTAQYRTALAMAGCLCFFFIQVFPVFACAPYYGTYYNPCWKTTDITRIITVGDGAGLDLAAKYLNTAPNAAAMHVQVSPLVAHVFAPYFDGHAYSAEYAAEHTPTYEIVYIRDSQIGRIPQTGTRKGELNAVLTLNGIPHVWIYRLPNAAK